MKVPGLIGGSLREYMLPFDAQDSINLYPVADKEGKEVAALYGTPGLKLFASVGTGPMRAEFSAANGRAFTISGSSFYEIDEGKNKTLRGSMQFSSGNVSIEENGFQLGMCDGQNFYIFNYETNEFKLVVSSTFTAGGVGYVTFIDGYFVLCVNKTGRFVYSLPYDGGTFPALNFATAESSPDDLLCCVNAVGQLWLLGTRTGEIWSNTGGSGVPFERISGAKMEVGIMAPHTALPLDNSLFWVGQDDKGAGTVYRARGFSPQRISTGPIEAIIQAAPDKFNIRAYTYQEKGRTFYVLTGGGLPITLAYDLETQIWCKRAYLNEAGFFEQHLASCCMYAFGKQLVGDRRNGNVYEMSSDIFTDNGDLIGRERIFQHLGDEFKRIRYNKLVVGFETGVGLQNGQGSVPAAMLSLSKDGARTWSNWFTASIGSAGQYLTNVAFRRLGLAQQMTFKIRITDPVKVAICGAYIE